jgi:hypothetical protein
LLASCSGNVVVMGENTDEEDSFVPPPYSRCIDNRTLSGDVVVTNQAELDALEGCTTIDGHVLVQPLFNPDLRPLHRLRVVQGEFGLGGSIVYRPRIELTTEEASLEEEIRSAGVFLPSLRGLERLETVGTLTLVGIVANSLEPLAQLRNLTADGTLGLFDCDSITDLLPLTQLTGIQRLSVFANNLESLDGLQIRDRLVSLGLEGERLANIDALSRLREVSTELSIDSTALRDLAPLAQLEHTGGLGLSNNAALETLHGLEALQIVDSYLVVTNNGALQDTAALNGLLASESINVSYNVSLRRLADFPELGASSIQITDNPLLQELPVLQGRIYGYSRTSDAEVLLAARGQVEIARNAALQRFTVPQDWIGGVYVIIRDNESLRELDLRNLETLDLLDIGYNPALETVRLGALASVDTLEVVKNPLLPPAAFDAVRTFERTMRGNAP